MLFDPECHWLIFTMFTLEFSYPVRNLINDQFMDKTEISNEVLFLYDNSINFTNVKDNERYDGDSEILRWQVEKYKNGAKPGKVVEDWLQKS